MYSVFSNNQYNQNKNNNPRDDEDEDEDDDDDDEEDEISDLSSDENLRGNERHQFNPMNTDQTALNAGE